MQIDEPTGKVLHSLACGKYKLLDKTGVTGRKLPRQTDLNQTLILFQVEAF